MLMDGDAQIVSMSKGQDHPLHIVPIGWSMKSVREKFGDDIHPGDIFLHNDPYTGGTHLNDVAMIYPLFADGRLFVFPVVRAHWGDVGGMSPGSLSGDATEIFQEGVRIPPIRIVDRGHAQPGRARPDLRQHARAPRAQRRLRRDDRHLPQGGRARGGARRALRRPGGARRGGRADGPRRAAHAPRDRRAARRRVLVRGASRERARAARAAQRSGPGSPSRARRSPSISPAPRPRPRRPPTWARRWRPPGPSRSSSPSSTRAPT